MTLTLPSFFKTISGRVGDLVFYVSRGRQYARRYVVPCNPDTAGQRIIRSRFAGAVSFWQSLSVYKKSQWNRRAVHLQMSGYNLCISRCLKSAAEKESDRSDLDDSPSLQISCLSVFAQFRPGAVADAPFLDAVIRFPSG